MNEKNNVPTLNLGYRQLKNSTKRAAPKTRDPVLKKKQKVSDESERLSNWDHNYNHVCKCSKNCQCLGCVQKETQLQNMRHELCEVEKELHLHECKKESILEKFISSDEKVSKFTGLLSKDQFNDLCEHLKPASEKMQYWQGVKKTNFANYNGNKRGPSRKLSNKEEFLLVLMKLRQGLHNDMLGEIFGVSETTVSSVINSWVKFLSYELKPLIKWPTRESVLQCMPVSLANLKNLRCTIDCTEVFIERPRDRQV